jgi:hypothetical protein
MEGEHGYKVDQNMMQQRTEREAEAKAAMRTSQKRGMPSYYLGGKAEESKGRGPNEMPKRAPVEKFWANLCETLGENVMEWFSGLSDNMEHGSVAMLDETMTELGVPAEGMNSVAADYTAVRRIFNAASRDDTCVGRAAPRTEAALKAEWERLTSTTSTGIVYLWYTQMQKKAIAHGIPLIPFRRIVLSRGMHGLCLPGLGLEAYEICGRTFECVEGMHA